MPPLPKAPVVLRMLAPKALRVRIAAGSVGPCDSTVNEKIFEGKVEPGATLTWNVATNSVCIEHTTLAFSDVDWVQSRIVYRQGGRKCEWSTQPLDVTVSASE